MRWIVGINVEDQAYGGKWIVYESIVDILMVYIYICSDEVCEVLKVELDQMV